MSPSAAATSAAREVLQRRAMQCSFSSIFHLRRAGMQAKDAEFTENLFVGTVGVPLLLMGLTGVYVWSFPPRSTSACPIASTSMSASTTSTSGREREK